MKLEGRVALVSGGGGGMGGAQCRLFAQEGAAVCVTDMFLDKAQAVADDINAAGGKAIAVKLEVTKAADWADAVAATERAFGPVSILCNNAGANFRNSFDEQTEEQFRIIVESMVVGSFLGIKATVPSMRKAGRGVIINLGSLSSIRPGGGSPGYGVGKTGLIGLTRSAALSYAKENIRCVLISPGHVDTPFIRGNNSYSPNDASTSIDNPENYERRLKATPLGRFQLPDDIAKAVLFAVSDDAEMITGTMITVDGGASL
ncbi:MAG: SDR family oxidoreductase [Chloroflexi bacterium]|nr:SDR family oxidoreductase [Chloroflexota bacterium]